MPKGTLGDYIKRLKLPQKSKFLTLPKGDSPIKTYTVGNYHITIKFEKIKSLIIHTYMILIPIN